MDTDIFFRALSSSGTISDAFREELIRNISFISLPKNHFLVKGTETVKTVFFLQKGLCMTYTWHDERRVVSSFCREGEIILSPKSFFSQLPSTEFIQLLEPSDLFCVSYDAVEHLFKNFREAAWLFNNLTANYHFATEQRLIEALTQPTAKRYHSLIKTYPGIEQRVSQEIIAAYLGITFPP